MPTNNKKAKPEYAAADNVHCLTMQKVLHSLLLTACIATEKEKKKKEWYVVWETPR